MNKPKDCFNFILDMKMKGRRKEIAEYERMNKPKDCFNFILDMKIKERKKK